MHEGAIRLGLVGVGKIAQTQHIPALVADPRFALVATASPHGEVAGIPAFSDLTALLDSGLALDAVSLCTPPAARLHLATQALAAGLHVMLEKPPAIALSQLEAMRGAALRHGCSLFTTWHSRETVAVDAARAYLAGRRIDHVAVKWRESVRQWHPGQDWLLAPGGFGVFDPAINAFSILTAILPGPLAVESARLSVPVNRAMPMQAQVTMIHDGEAPVECDLDILHEGEQQWDIVIATDAGQVLLDRGGHRLFLPDGTMTAGGEDREYARLYDRFAALVPCGASDVDARPLMLAGDALLVGVPSAIDAFTF